MQRPAVGLGVIIRKGKKVLLGRRINSHGENTWCFPGGHLEYKESFEQCAIRETKEETGIEIANIKLGTVVNNYFEKGDKHYVTIIMVADHKKGEARIMEPDKCDGWQWFSWEELPQPLFGPVQSLVEQKFNPFS